MNKLSLPPFTEVSEALSQTALKYHPSEAHGLMSGMLCGETEASLQAIMPVLTGDEGVSAAHETLQAMYQGSTQQLAEFLFEFALLMPDDDAPLAVRAEALTLWCQGFLTGLTLASVPIENREPSELTEAISDLVEIAKMNYEQVVDSEEDEQAFAELVEYVRMAVILIFQSQTNSGEPSTEFQDNLLH